MAIALLYHAHHSLQQFHLVLVTQLHQVQSTQLILLLVGHSHAVMNIKLHRTSTLFQHASFLSQHFVPLPIRLTSLIGAVSLPSSINIIAAMPVIGLVME